MKKLLFILIVAMILSSCRSKFVEYPFDENFDDGTGLEPVITGFNGELFSDENITVDGLFTGSEKLDAVTNMMYCSDDGSIIWWDWVSGNLYRLDLNHKNEKTKICADENCRNDINSPCPHFVMFDCLYTNGWLYYTNGGVDWAEQKYKNKEGTYKKAISKCAFIYRYNVDTHERQKLMGFQGVTECELVLNGRYLYAQTYTWEYSAVAGGDVKVDFGITRIDLYQENAIIVYSDIMYRDDFNKLCDHPAGYMFSNDKIIMPANDTINICNAEMRNIKTLIELEKEYIRDLYFYGEDIYFMSDKGLCRVNMEIYNKYAYIDEQDDKTALLDTNKREILNKNIVDYCIDGEFLYYTLSGDNRLYRVKLDYSRELEFNNAVMVYAPEQGFVRWKVFKNHFYATVQIENSAWRCRIKLLSEQEPYLFYKEYEINFLEE